jgi:hypothetical protein
MQNDKDFIDIPVAISNLKSDSNAYPNKGKIGPEDLVFVRRFVITDAHTGIVGAQECPNPSSVSGADPAKNPNENLKVQKLSANPLPSNKNQKPNIITFLSSSKLVV